MQVNGAMQSASVTQAAPKLGGVVSGFRPQPASVATATKTPAQTIDARGPFFISLLGAAAERR